MNLHIQSSFSPLLKTTANQKMNLPFFAGGASSSDSSSQEDSSSSSEDSAALTDVFTAEKHK